MQNTVMLGSTWSISAAMEHVERIELEEHTRFLSSIVPREEDPDPETPELPIEVSASVRRRACDGLLMALRDGYIRATGRLSTTQVPISDPDTMRSWRLHASDHSLITTAEWRMGEFDFDRWVLNGPSWQYIQIEVPEFMVKAIWPDDTPGGARPQVIGPRDTAYTTPYLELMQAAIARFGLTEDSQSKKENLSDWFLQQQVEGEPVSQNLADAMATLIRLPSAQRGGAKRVSGPYFRKTG